MNHQNSFVMEEIISWDSALVELFYYRMDAESLYQFLILGSYFRVHEVNIL